MLFGCCCLLQQLPPFDALMQCASFSQWVDVNAFMMLSTLLLACSVVAGLQEFAFVLGCCDWWERVSARSTFVAGGSIGISRLWSCMQVQTRGSAGASRVGSCWKPSLCEVVVFPAAMQTTRCILRKIQVSDNTPVSSVHYIEYLCVSMSSTFQYVNVSNETLTGTLHYLMTAK